jgi:fructokinase
VADRDGTAGELIARLPEGVSVLHVGGLALIPPDDDKVVAVVQAARQRGALISVDANLRPVVVGRDAVRQQAYREAVSRVMALADVIKLSDEDITAMGWSAAADDDEALQAVAQGLIDGGASLVALTLGAQGAMLVNRQGAIRRAVPTGVSVVDTVGAGDCFQAGLLAWFKKAGRLQPALLGEQPVADLDAALQHAMAAAAINVQRQGCQPPSWLETRAWVAQRGGAVAD